jgi:hypothetical protein
MVDIESKHRYTINRDLVKYVRDRAKSRYNKDKACYICGKSDNLDFHHLYGLTQLLAVWLRNNKLSPTTRDEIMILRDVFIEEHSRELFEEAITLCHSHHLQLHSIYGKNPGLHTAKKQERWVEIQKCKAISLSGE